TTFLYSTVDCGPSTVDVPRAYNVSLRDSVSVDGNQLLIHRWGFLRLLDAIRKREVDLTSAILIVAFGVEVDAFGNGAHTARVEQVEYVEAYRSISFQHIFAQGKV